MPSSRITTLINVLVLVLWVGNSNAFSVFPSYSQTRSTFSSNTELYSSLSRPMDPPLQPPMPAKHILYDLPVSNNGARCRLIIYKKNIPTSEVEIVSPETLGGLKSEEYRRVNPQGKMPALVVQIFNANKKFGLSESDTIARYLMSKYASAGASFQPYNPLSNQIARFHDMYLTTIQGCLYKPSPPFGTFGTRQEALLEFERQLAIIDKLIIDDGLYLCGPEISYADATLFPTLVFAKYMMPKFVDKENFPGFTGELPPKLSHYFDTVQQWDETFEKIHTEIMTVLVGTWGGEKRRWNSIWLAGKRDTDERTAFDKIVDGELPVEIVRETADVLAFKDIKPAAPVHIVIIPKDRNGLTSLKAATPEHAELLGKLMLVAADIAKDEFLGFGPEGSRLVINDGPSGGQQVAHLNIHVLGGRPMNWPPG